jgi:hypothetical protein
MELAPHAHLFSALLIFEYSVGLSSTATSAAGVNSGVSPAAALFSAPFVVVAVVVVPNVGNEGRESRNLEDIREIESFSVPSSDDVCEGIATGLILFAYLFTPPQNLN